VHVHIDYDEFYTLPRGKVLLGLSDIRRQSPTFGRSVQFPWSDQDGVAVVVPQGVAHAVLFEKDSVLVFGLSGYYDPDWDVVGCRWDDPRLGFTWPERSVIQSARDAESGDYDSMIRRYEELSQRRSASMAAAAS
jgi:dTDP-4-dehydrorhamnose 3,5-epimerase